MNEPEIVFIPGFFVRSEKIADWSREERENPRRKLEELARNNEALKKQLNDIELLCYSDGSDGEILAKIMTYFSKADE